jgi:hypothetical protein
VGRLGHDASQDACLHADCRGRIDRVVRVLSLPGRGLRCIPGCPAPHWQRPSPLPPRNSAAWQAGDQSPRPAPDPPMAGASPPPGRALAFVVLGGPVLWKRGLWPGGETRCVSWSRPDWRSLTPKHKGFRIGSAACRKSACPHHKREMIRTAASTHPARFVPTPPHLAEEMRLRMLNSH